MNSGVSSAAAPLRMNISLNVPLSVPSALRAVVADDVVDQRVVEDAEVLEGVDQPADVVVGVLQEPGVDLHLPGQHRLELLGHVIPGRDLLGRARQLASGGNDAELLLAGEGLARAARPSRHRTGPCTCPTTPSGTWCGRVRRAGREVDEERLVRHQRLLLADPADRLVGHVLGEVVALLRRRSRLDRRRALVERRVVLVGLAADEAVEVLEAAAAGRPVRRTAPSGWSATPAPRGTCRTARSSSRSASASRPAARTCSAGPSCSPAPRSRSR